MAIEEEPLDDFSGGFQHGASPVEFSGRQWASLYGFVLEDERRLRTQPHRALLRAAFEDDEAVDKTDIGVIPGQVDILFHLGPGGRWRHLPPLGEDVDTEWVGKGGVITGSGNHVIVEVPYLADDTWRAGVLLNTVFPSDASQAIILHQSGPAGDPELATKTLPNRYPATPDTDDAMPYANVGTMWGDFLVLGDIRWVKDQDETFSEVNSTRVPHGLWFSQPTSVTNWDPIDVELIGSGRGDRTVVGLFAVDVGLVVLTTDGVHLLRGNPASYSYEVLREGIGPPTRHACTYWPHQGVVVWADERGRVWSTDGNEVSRLDRPLPGAPVTSITPITALRLQSGTGRARHPGMMQPGNRGLQWTVDLAPDDWTTPDATFATFTEGRNIRVAELRTDGSGRPRLWVLPYLGSGSGPTEVVGNDPWPFAPGERAEVRCTAQSATGGADNGLLRIEARAEGEDAWDVLAETETDRVMLSTPVMPILGHVPATPTRGLRVFHNANPSTSIGAGSRPDHTWDTDPEDVTSFVIETEFIASAGSGVIPLVRLGFGLGTTIRHRMTFAVGVGSFSWTPRLFVVQGSGNSVLTLGDPLPGNARWVRVSWASSTGLLRLEWSVDGELWHESFATTYNQGGTVALSGQRWVGHPQPCNLGAGQFWNGEVHYYSARINVNGVERNPQFKDANLGTQRAPDALGSPGDDWIAESAAGFPATFEDGLLSPQPVAHPGLDADVYSFELRSLSSVGGGAVQSTPVSRVQWEHGGWTVGDNTATDALGQTWHLLGDADAVLLDEIVVGHPPIVIPWDDILIASRGGRLWALKSFAVDEAAWTELAWSGPLPLHGFPHGGAVYTLSASPDSEEPLARPFHRLDPDHPDRGNLEPAHLHSRPLGVPHRKTFWHRLGARWRGPGALSFLAAHTDRGGHHVAETVYEETGDGGNAVVAPAPGPSNELQIAAEFDGDVTVEGLSVWFHQGRPDRDKK